MGALIQTKGTQRLAKWFNDVFSHDPNLVVGLNLARRIRTAGGETLTQSFKKVTNSLWEISDTFIAQNATPPNLVPIATTWPRGGNDVLYPSATMTVETAVSLTVLRFRLPAGVSTIPTFIEAGAAVSYLKGGRKKVQRGTIVTATPIAPSAPGGTFDVTLSRPLNSGAAVGDHVVFAKGKHQQLVRRWRWYLKNDLRPENDSAIRQAILSALEDVDCRKIAFQAIEDTQRVITRTETLLDDVDLEFGDEYNLHLVLMTEQTTAPDPLDPQ